MVVVVGGILFVCLDDGVGLLRCVIWKEVVGVMG